MQAENLSDVKSDTSNLRILVYPSFKNQSYTAPFSLLLYSYEKYEPE